VTTSQRVYERLLVLYPPAFRLRYQAELVQLFGDQLQDARSREGSVGLVMTWFRGLGDLVVTAASEHARGDRGVGQSLEEAPSGVRRLLGIVGVLGGLGILAVFVASELIFETLPWLITVRIVLFNIGAIAVILGLRASAPAGSLSRAGTLIFAAAAVSNAWYAGMTMLPVIGWAPFAGDHYVTLFLAGVSMWVSDTAFGLVVARRGGRLRVAGLALAVGSVLALLGMDRFGLVDGDFSGLFVPLALGGQGIGGIAWVLLGLDVATRRRPLPVAAGAGSSFRA
jgi:hypothetical protein